MRITTNHLRKAASGVVFGVAAWQSYWHTVEVSTRYGEGSSAYIMAFSIDGLMTVAAGYVSHAKTKLGGGLAFAAFGLGVVAMLGMNYLAADPNPLSRAVAVYPALAMVLTGAMLHWSPQAAKPVRKRPAVRTRNVTPITKAKRATAV